MPTETSTRSPSTTGPPVAQIPPSRPVGTAYESTWPAPLVGTDSTLPT
ncbi:hypothetical protein [Kitasatospora paranensis]